MFGASDAVDGWPAVSSLASAADLYNQILVPVRKQKNLQFYLPSNAFSSSSFLRIFWHFTIIRA